jgi:hypothetical protein
MTELQRETPLFDKLIPIEICSADMESQKTVHLAFRIISGTRSTPSAGQVERLFHFEVFYVELFLK